MIKSSDVSIGLLLLYGNFKQLFNEWITMITSLIRKNHTNYTFYNGFFVV